MLQLVAGSEIDTLFGAKLGLSTLAAAGLGNMVSDVAGVSMANRIEVGFSRDCKADMGSALFMLSRQDLQKQYIPLRLGEVVLEPYQPLGNTNHVEPLLTPDRRRGLFVETLSC